MMQRYLIALCLALCVRPADAEKTSALAEFSGVLERLATSVARRWSRCKFQPGARRL